MRGEDPLTISSQSRHVILVSHLSRNGRGCIFELVLVSLHHFIVLGIGVKVSNTPPSAVKLRVLNDAIHVVSRLVDTKSGLSWRWTSRDFLVLVVSPVD